MDHAALPLSRALVDRAAHRRTDPGLLPAAWRDPAARVVLVRGGAVATTEGRSDEVSLDLRPAVQVRAAELRVAHGPTAPTSPDQAFTGSGLWLFLGVDGPMTLLALVVDGAERDADLEGVRSPGLTDLLGEVDWSSLREVGHLLSDRDAGLATVAAGLAAWHERHPRCPRCGEHTTPEQGGWIRRCTAEGSDHYPRTDPAVIMAVTDDQDRLLLGHAAHWPAARFSTLAGYVEPGEPLEAAVRREVAEETGVLVGEVTYQGSQPWPFPASLMLAFTAQAVSTEVVVDGLELTEARWFTRAELSLAVREGRVVLPMRTSVSRALIEDWFGGPVG